MNERKIIVPNQPVAITEADLSKFGCPHCGHMAGFTFVRAVGARTWTCDSCHHSCAVLSLGVEKSPIGIGVGRTSFYPELIEHPFGGGEKFKNSCLSVDHDSVCFVCGKDKDTRQRLSGEVEGVDAGKRIVDMFECGASLIEDGVGTDGTWVKIGVCSRHTTNLSCLFTMIINRRRHTITAAIVRNAMALK